MAITYESICVLRNIPNQYIYEPWMAPPAAQKLAKCIVGVDYPAPIVDHAVISKKNIERMKAAFALHAANQAGFGNNDDDDGDDEDTPKTSAKSMSVESKQSVSKKPRKL